MGHWTPGFLIAWDIGVVLYLSLVFWLAAQADTTFIRRRSELQDVGRFAVPGATVVGGTRKSDCRPIPVADPRRPMRAAAKSCVGGGYDPSFVGVNPYHSGPSLRA